MATQPWDNIGQIVLKQMSKLSEQIQKIEQNLENLTTNFEKKFNSLTKRVQDNENKINKVIISEMLILGIVFTFVIIKILSFLH